MPELTVGRRAKPANHGHGVVWPYLEDGLSPDICRGTAGCIDPRTVSVS
jgi:hypothetical protein